MDSPWNFLRSRKRYWLMPIVLILLGLAGLLLLTEGAVFSQFHYPDF